MTALTVPARAHENATLRPMPWRRMAWVIWRQHRFALAGVAALLGALAVYLWIVGSLPDCSTCAESRSPPGRCVPSRSAD